MRCTAVVRCTCSSVPCVIMQNVLTFVAFLFQIVENRKSALSDKMEDIGFSAAIRYLSQGGPGGHGGNTRGSCPFLRHGQEVGSLVDKPLIPR